MNKIEGDKAPIITEADRLNRLKLFIQNHGGAIPFDLFMQESLYGASGYYHDRVEIGTRISGGHFNTYASSSLFGEAFFRYCSKFLNQLPQGKIVELAGGTGSFKRQFLNKAKLRDLNIPYLSLDISDKMVREQAILGGSTVQASALSLPLPDQSLTGVIFMNELIDSLPFKLTRARLQDGEFIGFEELWYVLDSQGNIQPQYRPLDPNVEKDYWLKQEDYLRQRGFHRKRELIDKQTFCINLNETVLLREVTRVLRQGIIIIVDYGSTVDGLIYGRKLIHDDLIEPFGLRIYPKRWSQSSKDAFKSVYSVDLTTNVNFTNLILKAEELGLKVLAYYPQKYFIYDQYTKEEEEYLKNLLTGKRKIVVPNEIINIEERKTLIRDLINLEKINDRNTGYKVLVLEKLDL